MTEQEQIKTLRHNLETLDRGYLKMERKEAALRKALKRIEEELADDTSERAQRINRIILEANHEH